MLINRLDTTTYPGVVESNDDPLRAGRLKVRVFGLFDNLSVEDIPWANPSFRGKAYSVPYEGDVVNVTFAEDDPHVLEWTGNEHYNVNLQKYIESLDLDNYRNAVVLSMDHSYQNYWHPDRGLTLDSERTNIRLDQNGNIKLNLRDAQSNLHLGTDDADQAVILGNHFLDWFDDFVDNLMGAQGGPYMGNLLAPVTPTPTLIAVLQRYQALRDPTFLSHNVFAVDNGRISAQRRPLDPIRRAGDAWDSSLEENTLSVQEVEPPDLVDRDASDLDENPEAPGRPGQGRQLVMQEPDAGGSPAPPPVAGEPGDWPPHSTDHWTYVTISGRRHPSGQLPRDVTVQNRFVGTRIGAGGNRMLPKASEAFSALFEEFMRADFEGKQPIIITSCYRTQEEQDRLNTPRFQSKTPGDHGLGITVDFDLGFAGVSLNKSLNYLSYTCPNYQWFFYNAPRFGIWQPDWALKSFENWHWTYHGISRKNYDAKIKELQSKLPPRNRFWEAGKGWDRDKYAQLIRAHMPRWKDTPPKGNASIAGLK